MGAYGTEKKGSKIQPEVGTNFEKEGNRKVSDKYEHEPEKTMASRHGSKAPEHTNHVEHDKMLHSAMPAGYKGGMSDAEEEYC